MLIEIGFKYIAANEVYPVILCDLKYMSSTRFRVFSISWVFFVPV